MLFCGGLITELAEGPGWLARTLLLACYASRGWEPGWAGLQALRDKTLDVDLLMVLAAIGAAAIGQVLDGGLLIVIFATSGALEAVATHRTAESVRGLLDLAPDCATRLTGTGEQSVDTASHHPAVHREDRAALLDRHGRRHRSVIVGLNGLRLLRNTAWQRAPAEPWSAAAAMV